MVFRIKCDTMLLHAINMMAIKLLIHAISRAKVPSDNVAESPETTDCQPNVFDLLTAVRVVYKMFGRGTLTLYRDDI